jgi:hypothetical protein
MKTSRTSSIDLSTLPAELRSLGRPLSVHRPWAVALEDAKNRFLAKLFGENWRSATSGSGFQRAVLFGFAALMGLCGFGFIWAFYFRPPKDGDPRILLIVAGFTFVFALVLAGGGVFYRGPREKADAGPTKFKGNKQAPDLYLVYKDGLAAVTGDACEYFAWTDIEEVGWFSINLDSQLVLTTFDDRHLVVWKGFTEMGELRQAICQRVNGVMLPRVLSNVADGKSVEFGPFTLRRSGLKYKDRKASWNDVTSMKIVNNRGEIRLTIYTKARLFPWCWCNIYKIPNFDTFYDAICRTAPDHLLTTSTRPRW